jgi:hypothetical protein
MPEAASSLAATLNLNSTEERIIARLLSQGYLSREQICLIAARANRPIAHASVNAIIYTLRKKLGAYNVEIATVSSCEFEISQQDRRKVFAALARSTPSATTNRPTKPIRSSPVSSLREQL